MEKLIYKLNKTNVFIKLFVLAFILHLAIVMVILLFIFIGFYIPELAKYKNKKRDL